MSKSVRVNFIYNITLTIGQVLIPLLSFPYLTRVLKPNGIGLIGFVDSIVTYMIMLASMGIPIYGVREIAKCFTKEDRDRLFSEIFSIHLLAILGGLVIYSIVVLSFTKTYSNLPFFAMGVISYVAGNLTFEWFFQGSENYKFITIRTLLVRSVVLIAIFVFIKNQNDLLLYYGILNAGLFINTIINLAYLKKQISFSLPILSALRQHVQPIFRLFATRFATSVYVVLLNALIGFLSTDKAVGYFSAAYKVYFVSLTSVIAYNTVIIPKMTKSYAQGDEVAMHYYTASAYNFLIDFAIPFSIFIIINSFDVVQLIAGSQFDRSVTDVQILAPLIFIIGFSNVFAMNILTPMGNDKYFLYSVTAGMLFSLLVTVPLIIYYSDLGASAGLFLTELFICALLAHYVKKTWQLTLDFKRLALCILLLTPFYFIHILISHYVLGSFITLLCNGILSVLYWLFLQVFVFKNKQYFAWIKQSVYKIVSLKSGKSL